MLSLIKYHCHVSFANIYLSLDIYQEDGLNTFWTKGPNLSKNRHWPLKAIQCVSFQFKIKFSTTSFDTINHAEIVAVNTELSKLEADSIPDTATGRFSRSMPGGFAVVLANLCNLTALASHFILTATCCITHYRVFFSGPPYKMTK